MDPSEGVEFMSWAPVEVLTGNEKMVLFFLRL